MTIDEAIETQELYLYHPYIKQLLELQKAMRLSNGALEEVKRYRSHHVLSKIRLLSGETE